MSLLIIIRVMMTGGYNVRTSMTSIFIPSIPPRRKHIDYDDDDDDDDDENQEMVGLLANSDHPEPCTDIRKTTWKKKKKSNKRLCADMKPLEVMHASVERRFASKSSTLACRVGILVFILSIFLGTCVWIRQHYYESHSNMDKETTNYNHPSKIKYWCLDVRKFHADYFLC
jgi:hypothetical protein